MWYRVIHRIGKIIVESSCRQGVRAWIVAGAVGVVIGAVATYYFAHPVATVAGGYPIVASGDVDAQYRVLLQRIDQLDRSVREISSGNTRLATASLPYARATAANALPITNDDEAIKARVIVRLQSEIFTNQNILADIMASDDMRQLTPAVREGVVAEVVRTLNNR
jgi:hypothetical protein